MRELAARLDPPISIQAIGKYETGRMMPSAPVLQGLCRILDVPGEFLLGGRIDDLEAEESDRTPRASKQEIGTLEFLMLEGIENRLAVEPKRVSNPFGELEAVAVSRNSEIEDLAQRLRARWKVGSGPVPDMRNLLESYGIRVIEGDLPERFSGSPYRALVRKTGLAARAVFLSSRLCEERKRLALASELGRRVILWPIEHRVPPSRAWQRFGGAFLVPGDSLCREAGVRRKRVARREALDLKAHYGVPAVTLLMRLRETGILPRRECNRLLRGPARAWRDAEPSPMGLRIASAESGFERLVWRALSEERITTVRAAAILRQPVLDVLREAEASGLLTDHAS